MSDVYRNLLLWDSGLAFSHGPYGRESCLDILCGPENWGERTKMEFKEEHCSRICRFRNSTISSLESLSRSRPSGFPTLGERLKQAMKEVCVFMIFF
jgi:hypothetical protein